MDEAERELTAFTQIWNEKYPTISYGWPRDWANLSTLFHYPHDIGKVIYTTNAIESLNSVIRKTVNNRKAFSHEQAAMKLVRLAIEAAAKKWSTPVRDWKGALNRFMIEISRVHAGNSARG